MITEEEAKKLGIVIKKIPYVEPKRKTFFPFIKTGECHGTMKLHAVKKIMESSIRVNNKRTKRRKAKKSGG